MPASVHKDNPVVYISVKNKILLNHKRHYFGNDFCKCFTGFAFKHAFRDCYGA